MRKRHRSISRQKGRVRTRDMEPFAFVVCAKLCLIVPPTEGQSREACLYRMQVALAERPGERVMCQSLDVPYGEIIDSAGLIKTKPDPWKGPQIRDVW